MENPFITNKDYLVNKQIENRCSLHYSVADFALALLFPDHQDVDLPQMIENASEVDLKIAYELMVWHKRSPNDGDSLEVGKAIMKAMNQESDPLNSVAELFSHYRALNILIGETAKAAVKQVQPLLDDGAVLRPFPAPGEDHKGIFGHHIIINGEVHTQRFAVCTHHGNKKLSFGSKW
jgi:hypothetical protein